MPSMGKPSVHAGLILQRPRQVLALCALLGRFSALLDVVSHFALPAFLGTLVVLVLALLVNRREHRSAASLAALMKS